MFEYGRRNFPFTLRVFLLALLSDCYHTAESFLTSNYIPSTNYGLKASRRTTQRPSSHISRCPFCTANEDAQKSRRVSSFLQMSKGRGKNAQRRKEDEFLSAMNAPIEPKVADGIAGVNTVPPEEDDLSGLVRCIAAAADKRKAENICAIRISKISAMTSFVVVISGNSRPQNQAIAASILQDVRDTFDGEYSLVTSNGVPEGQADSGWILLDYGDVMVHVMTPRSRLYYDIEGRWLGDNLKVKGEVMDLSDVILPNTPVGEANGYDDVDLEDYDDTEASDNYDEEDDPFWS